jgi:hypothetical protein
LTRTGCPSGNDAMGTTMCGPEGETGHRSLYPHSGFWASAMAGDCNVEKKASLGATEGSHPGGLAPPLAESSPVKGG